MAELASRVRWRPAEPADEDFLRAVFRGTRAPELAALGEALIDMQYELQRRSYLTQYPDSHCHVIERLDGATPQPVGRLWVESEAGALQVLDIGLLPRHRGAGIGSAVLRELLAQAADSGRAVRLQVLRDNPARRLYDRLGFVVDGEHGLHLSLRHDVLEDFHHEQA